MRILNLLGMLNGSRLKNSDIFVSVDDVSFLLDYSVILYVPQKKAYLPLVVIPQWFQHFFKGFLFPVGG